MKRIGQMLFAWNLFYWFLPDKHQPISTDWNVSFSLFGLIHFQYKGCLVSFYYSRCFTKIPVFNANSVDHDQTSHSAASDHGLHCLSLSLFWDARLKWVKDSVIKGSSFPLFNSQFISFIRHLV